MPRVGNQDFANWVDRNLSGQVTHINKEPIPILSPMFSGFVHASGEIHITDFGAWENCPGELFCSSIVSLSGVRMRHLSFVEC